MEEVLWHSATCAIVEIDLGIDAEAADDPGDWIPVHLDQAALRTLAGRRCRVMVAM